VFNKLVSKLAKDYQIANKTRLGRAIDITIRRYNERDVLSKKDTAILQKQVPHAERLIGSIRRECLDHVVVFGEAHLRRILAAYTGYYNELRTHLSLEKDSPDHRPVQRLGQLAAQPILGGLHHHYYRI
jgi:Integrase core domain